MTQGPTPDPDLQAEIDALRARLAALEQGRLEEAAAALSRIESQLAELSTRLAAPAPSRVIPWWAFVGFLMLWGAVFHLIFR